MRWEIESAAELTESLFPHIISPMDIKELTEHMHAFVGAMGWYEPGTPRPQTLRNLAISLSLEANEVLEHFQWGEQPDDPNELAGELADVTLYLLQLASIAGIDLEQAVLDKLQHNYTRTWDQP
jgi:NTP pyrophosphatase (non-canonical NTP hydrolase)